MEIMITMIIMIKIIIMRIMLLIMKAIHRMCRNTLHMKTQRWSMISERIIIEWFGSEKTFKGHLSNPLQ